MVVTGVVKSGVGRATKAFVAERVEFVEKTFGWTPHPGTLNVRPAGPITPWLQKLPPPVARSEKTSRVGPMKWWPVVITSRKLAAPVEGALIRGQRSNTCYFELVAATSLRDAGLQNGDTVRFALISPSSWAARNACGET